jgi:2-dehydro-3-deoxygluconokinase
MLGNEEDFSAALGFEVEGLDPNLSELDPGNFGRMMAAVTREYPNIAMVGTTLRNARTATRNDWGAAAYVGGRLVVAATRPDLDILDRVGGGDSFASGLIYGLLKGYAPEVALEYGAAHGALAMTTPGDTSTASLAEVEAAMKRGTARVDR